MRPRCKQDDPSHSEEDNGCLEGSEHAALHAVHQHAKLPTCREDEACPSQVGGRPEHVAVVAEVRNRSAPATLTPGESRRAVHRLISYGVITLYCFSYISALLEVTRAAALQGAAMLLPFLRRALWTALMPITLVERIGPCRVRECGVAARLHLRAGARVQGLRSACRDIWLRRPRHVALKLRRAHTPSSDADVRADVEALVLEVRPLGIRQGAHESDEGDPDRAPSSRGQSPRHPSPCHERRGPLCGLLLASVLTRGGRGRCR
mmetsp:Transcript_84754/g.181594  ORF Transcript_84754/g.181594 Transcript_84754/m.181594 type:complete len:264 (+) Transcript_84754:325-1116(+)